MIFVANVDSTGGKMHNFYIAIITKITNHATPVKVHIKNYHKNHVPLALNQIGNITKRGKINIDLYF